MIQDSTQDFTAERPEKRFSGHVTLGRSKAIRHADAELLARLISGMAERPLGAWPAETVEVIGSELSSEGSRYSRLLSVPLTDSAVG